ncbi:MAG: formate dehydrogenase accessory protein FdhE [Acidobacteriota bacterium]
MGRQPPPKMVPGDFQTLTSRRARRARDLAVRYPASLQVLEFLAEVASFQATVSSQVPLDSLPALLALVARHAPSPLAEHAQRMNEATCRQAMEDCLAKRDTTSLRSFFARVLLQPSRFTGASGTWNSVTDLTLCPQCGHWPQVGGLRAQGDGRASSLVCSLCFYEWGFLRGRCPACGQAEQQRLGYYQAVEYPHIEVMACDVCRRYLHLIDLTREPEAVFDMDEAAALPLDVWAREQGFSKLQPNLAGI